MEIGDQYIADPVQNPSSETFIPLSLHFTSVSNIVALIMALTAFKVGRNDLMGTKCFQKFINLRA